MGFLRRHFSLIIGLILLTSSLFIFFNFSIFFTLFPENGILSNFYNAALSDVFIKNYIQLLILITFLGFWIPFVTDNERLNGFANYTPSSSSSFGFDRNFYWYF